MCQHVLSFVYRQLHPGFVVDHRVAAKPSRFVCYCCVHKCSTMWQTKTGEV